MISPDKPSPTMDMAVMTVRDLISKTPVATLATMYREIANTTRDSAQREVDKNHWQGIIDIIEISNDNEIADSFKAWVETAIDKTHPVIKKEFLLNVTNAILEVSRRS